MFDTKLALSIREACETLSISRTTVYGLIASSQLEARKIGRRTVVTMQSINRLLDAETPEQDHAR
ncbi:helix-turn-helix domain-containing protein [Sphingomonas sp.]|uniref:helix-turn-helix domain-containing protein n=1 Tax=Sphingomonas sp. TaxID=28214 RepID=UPI0035C84646